MFVLFTVLMLSNCFGGKTLFLINYILFFFLGFNSGYIQQLFVIKTLRYVLEIKFQKWIKKHD